jgi:DNA repair protein RadC
MTNEFNRPHSSWTPEKLMSFVLNGGSRYQSVDELAKRLNENFTSMEHLIQADEAALRGIKGIGPVKARQIMAMLELHKHWNAPKQLPQAVKKSADAVPYFDQLRYLSHEEFHVLYLNRAHVPISCLDLFRGGITGTVTDVRIVVKRAIALGATAMIVAHNHPSGALLPSENDKRMTRKLVDAAQTLDLTLLDHLIVTHSGYFSFSDQGLI